MLAEALAAGLRPEAVYATEAGLKGLPPGTGLDAVTFTVPDRSMGRLSDLETPPGIVAVFQATLASVEELLGPGAPAVLLAGIADPGNAGSLLRSAEIFGISRAVFAAGGVEPHNPKVVRATMGAFFRMRLAVAGPDELLAAAGRHGYTVVAASRDGIALPEFRFPQRPLIAIGHERRGVTGWLPRYDRSVAIPQRGAGESLNAATAGGIIFYAFSQQFGDKISEAQTSEKP
jgi:TrmH family RNA methyltransferase